MSPQTAPPISSLFGPDDSSTVVSSWAPAFTAGPYWPSFEQLRTGGNTALEAIKPGHVGTLRTKSMQFRILVEADFQRLLGLASEVHRIKKSITIVLSAAKVVAKHKDQESIDLFIQSASMLTESRLLPERDGHDRFEVTEAEAEKNRDDSSDITAATIRRPKL